MITLNDFSFALNEPGNPQLAVKEPRNLSSMDTDATQSIAARSKWYARWTGRFRCQANKQVASAFAQALRQQHSQAVADTALSNTGVDRILQTGKPLRARTVRTAIYAARHLQATHAERPPPGHGPVNSLQNHGMPRAGRCQLDGRFHTVAASSDALAEANRQLRHELGRTHQISNSGLVIEGHDYLTENESRDNEQLKAAYGLTAPRGNGCSESVAFAIKYACNRNIELLKTLYRVNGAKLNTSAADITNALREFCTDADQRLNTELLQKVSMLATPLPLQAASDAWLNRTRPDLTELGGHACGGITLGSRIFVSRDAQGDILVDVREARRPEYFEPAASHTASAGSGQAPAAGSTPTSSVALNMFRSVLTTKVRVRLHHQTLDANIDDVTLQYKFVPQSEQNPDGTASANAVAAPPTLPRTRMARARGFAENHRPRPNPVSARSPEPSRQASPPASVAPVPRLAPESRERSPSVPAARPDSRFSQSGHYETISPSPAELRLPAAADPRHRRSATGSPARSASASPTSLHGRDRRYAPSPPPIANQLFQDDPTSPGNSDTESAPGSPRLPASPDSGSNHSGSLAGTSHSYASQHSLEPDVSPQLQSSTSPQTPPPDRLATDHETVEDTALNPSEATTPAIANPQASFNSAKLIPLLTQEFQRIGTQYQIRDAKHRHDAYVQRTYTEQSALQLAMTEIECGRSPRPKFDETIKIERSRPEPKNLKIECFAAISHFVDQLLDWEANGADDDNLQRIHETRQMLVHWHDLADQMELRADSMRNMPPSRVRDQRLSEFAKTRQLIQGAITTVFDGRSPTVELESHIVRTKWHGTEAESASVLRGMVLQYEDLTSPTQ